MKSIALALLAACFVLISTGCDSPLPLPDQTTASKLIQDLIVENGMMPGGNMIDIHQLKIQKIEPGASLNAARIAFEIDFTRHPTSGLPPEYQTGEPLRQIEQHQATLTLDNGKWSVTDLSLR